MSAKILNFPSDRKQSNDQSFYNSNSTVESMPEYAFHMTTNQEQASFDQILPVREPAREMFTPDYFMLVE